jgi:hypothetical protein
MKKIITIILLATIVTSCKKDWNCKCTFSATGEVDVIQIKDKRKKDAKQICETTFQSSDATCALQ